MSKSKIKQRSKSLEALGKNQIQGGARVKFPLDSVNYDDRTPKFCLHYLTNGKYCLSQCQKNHKSSFADTIRILSQSKWKDIKGVNRHSNGYELINDKKLRKFLPKNSKITEDVNIIAFRYHGTNPMVGFRSNDIFHVLAFDHDHTLYKHS